MENISKALIITGGILLTILILTLIVFIFNRINLIPQEQIQQHGELGIIEFNRSFEVYQKPLMYGTDIISVINQAIDHNMRNGLLNENSNLFSRSFVNPIHGELMGIEVKLNSTQEELDLNTRVRIFYIKNINGSLRELEYTRGKGPQKTKKSYFKFNEIFKIDKNKNYKELLKKSGTDLMEKEFVTMEHPFKIETVNDFLIRKENKFILIAGDPSQDVQANKSLMTFLDTEPVTILNPDPNDKSWSKVIITPPSSKLKRLIFKSNDLNTEYYKDGRIKKMYFEERKIK